MDEEDEEHFHAPHIKIRWTILKVFICEKQITSIEVKP